jgi:prepilin-type N-terminal cleavage/methylation domain-containing protein
MYKERQKGFSLIEVMIALVILAVGLLALNSMQGTFATGNAQSRQFIRATDIAARQLEVLKNTDYDDNALDDTDGNGILNGIGTDADHNNTITSFPRDYNVFWNVAENATSNIKQVRIFVTWDQSNRHVDLDWIKPRNF